MEMAVSVFKATCLSVLERVRRSGETLIITKRGVPIAQVLPPPRPTADDSFGAMRSFGREIGDILEPAESAESWQVLAESDLDDGT